MIVRLLLYSIVLLLCIIINRNNAELTSDRIAAGIYNLILLL